MVSPLTLVTLLMLLCVTRAVLTVSCLLTRLLFIMVWLILVGVLMIFLVSES